MRQHKGIERLRWVQSEGGPLVLIQESIIEIWKGIRGSEESSSKSDYERACEINDEIAVLASPSGWVLVLGDEPHQTTWLADDEGGWLVRWVYADADVIVHEAVRASPFNRAPTGAELEIDVVEPGLCRLFDAANPGHDIQGDSLELYLMPGTYRVRTGYFDPDARTRFLTHRFARVAGYAQPR